MKTLCAILTLVLTIQTFAGTPSAKTRKVPAEKMALLKAAGSGDVRLLKSLIAKKSDLNQKDEAGNSPLFLALSNDQTETAKVLINAGSPLENTNQFGESALVTAVSFNNAEIIKLILKKKPSLLNLADEEKQTPLMKAAQVGSVETVKILVAAGADLKARDKFNRTAYDIAKESQNSESLKYLQPK